MKFLIWFLIWSIGVFAFAQNQAVPGPTLPPPISKILSGYAGHYNPTSSLIIAASGTTSGALYLKGFELTGVVIPSTFTGTSISFMTSLDGTNYYVLKNTYAGTTVAYTVAPSEFIAIAPADFEGVNYLKIVSNATEGAQRTLNIATRGL